MQRDKYMKKYSTLLVIACMCPILRDHKDCSLPGSSVHVILQARILGWVAMPSSRGPSQPRDRTHICYVYLPTTDITNWLQHSLLQSPVIAPQIFPREILQAASASLSELAHGMKLISYYGKTLPHRSYDDSFFLLKDNCFTEFCCFLSNLNMNQP